MSAGENHIQLLIASDINYAPFYGVMLTSLFENNKENAFDIHLLTDSTWTEEETRKFEQLVAAHNSHFCAYPVDKCIMEKYPLKAHLNLSTYYNLFAVDILPESIHKIIYMDGDMIVNGDLRKLWDLDISKCACAMAINCTYFDQSYYDRLQYDSQWGYSNNGTTLYNFDYLRKIKFSEKAVDYINAHRERIYWMDQDVQNALLHEKMLRLPIEYNFQTLFLHHSDWDYYDETFRMQILDAASHPVVIHYCGHLKPWNFRYYKMPYGRIWRDVCSRSLWPEAYRKRPLWNYLKFMVKRVLFPQRLEKARRGEYIDESQNFM